MRVVFLEDVEGVAQGGEVKEVKNGFARNYLIPKRLAMPSTREALKRVDRLKDESHDKRLKTLADMKALSEQLDGSRVDIEMRAGASGRLYGSVTNAIIADKLSEMTEREIDRRTIEIADPIRQVGIHDVRARLHAEVNVNIAVLVYPAGSEPDEFLSELRAAQEAAAAEKEDKSGDETDELAEDAEAPSAEPGSPEPPAADEEDEAGDEAGEPAADE